MTNLFSIKDIDKLNCDIFKTKLLQCKMKGNAIGLSDEEVKHLIELQLNKPTNHSSSTCSFIYNFMKSFNLFIFGAIVMILAMFYPGKTLDHSRCLVENNYLVMEITRPITDCNICKGINSFRILENVTKDEFADYAYLGQPLLIKGGCKDWTALEVFSYDFFKHVYNTTKGAYKSVEEECQFFPFRTQFLSLQEVFDMPESRAKRTSDAEETWYIGWSNCNPDVSSILRKHYSRPYFLPDDSELSAIDWIFMGYSGQGASMHLDYVQRPSWQAQIKGRKFWHLLPPPECETDCTAMNITVYEGDIILIDTNQWYHTTVVDGDKMSITLGSEYD